MIKKLYSWLYKAVSRPEDSGQRFGGRLQSSVRSAALELCAGLKGSVLEIGCGSGLFLTKLAAGDPSLDIVGIDNDRDMLEGLREKAGRMGLKNIRLEHQDGEKLSMPDGQFDAVICVNTFINHDLAAISSLLKEMRRVCKNGGKIIFEFRSSRNPLSVIKYALAKYYDATLRVPVFTHDPSVIERAVAQAGLFVASKKYLGFPARHFAPVIFIEAVKR